jgi:hypothetical protein
VLACSPSLNIAAPDLPHLRTAIMGVYDKLLNYCFGPGRGFNFYVAAQNTPINIVFLVVFDRNDKPVFIVDVKDDS